MLALKDFKFDSGDEDSSTFEDHAREYAPGTPFPVSWAHCYCLVRKPY